MSQAKRTRTPVFIVGAPRSGTTLLKVTLNRHPLLAVCGETHFFRRIYSRRAAFGDPSNPRNRDRIVSAYLAIEPARRLGMDLDVLRERMMREGVSWRDLFGSMFRTYAAANGKIHAGEKTPRHALDVKTMCEWYPDCTIIHLVRDPRAAVYSLTQVPWASRSVLIGAREWYSLNTAAQAVSTRDNYILLKYEDLVAQPEEQLRRLCNHIGLEFCEAMLQPDPAEFDPARPVQRAYSRVTAARVGLWRTDLEPWQVMAIEAVADRRMQEFGYERQTNGATGSMARATLEAVAETAFQKLVRAPSIYYHFLQPTNLAAEEKWFKRAATIYGRLRSRPVPGDQRPPATSGGD